MRILGGGEVSRDEVLEPSFEAGGDLEAALNEAYIKLLEFAHDREVRASDERADSAARIGLRACLDKIIEGCDRQPLHVGLSVEPRAVRAGNQI